MKIKLIISIVFLAFLLIPSLFSRTWTLNNGKTIEGELMRLSGKYVIMRKPDGRVKWVRVKELSQADKDFLSNKETNSSSKKNKAPTKSKSFVSEKEFMRVMKESCVRCHKKPCASVNALIKYRWFKAGDPQKSLTYTIIGKHRKKNGKYHNLSKKDTDIVYEFIKNYK